jgi:hypothetical protein
MKPTLKFVRFVGTKLMLYPTADGKKVVVEELKRVQVEYKEGTDEIGKAVVATVDVDLGVTLKYLKTEQNFIQNKFDIYCFTENEKQFYLSFPNDLTSYIAPAATK